jgi:multimeric flavodoxin WrbA
VKVIGLLGSPRRNGNTEVLLDRALDGAAEAGAETEKISLCGLNISGCIECNDCMETGYCTIGDEMDDIYQALERADRLILASPMFFMGVSSQAKAVIDRCQCYWALKYVLEQEFPREKDAPKRHGMFIGVGGTRGEHLFDGTLLTLRYFFDAIAMERHEELYVLVKGVDAKGDVLEHEDALNQAFESGKKLAQL